MAAATAAEMPADSATFRASALSEILGPQRDVASTGAAWSSSGTGVKPCVERWEGEERSVMGFHAPTESKYPQLPGWKSRAGRGL